MPRQHLRALFRDSSSRGVVGPVPNARAPEAKSRDDLQRVLLPEVWCALLISGFYGKAVSLAASWADPVGISSLYACP